MIASIPVSNVLPSVLFVRLVSRRATSRIVPKSILQKLREERLDYLQKAARVMEVCRGVEDPASVTLRNLWEETKRERL